MPQSEKRIYVGQLLSRVSGSVEQSDDTGSFMINIAGQSAVGKSTVMDILARGLGPCSTVSMDSYLRGWSIGPLNHDSGDPNKPYYAGLNPNVYDLPRLYDDLVKLKNGQYIEQPVFDEVIKVPSGTRTMCPNPVVIVNGIYALSDPFLGLADLAILIEAPLHDRLMRKLVRNHLQYKQEVDGIIRTYLSKDEPTYAFYQQELSGAADLTVDNPADPEQEHASLLSAREVTTFGTHYTATPKPQYGVLHPAERLTFSQTEQGVNLEYSVANRLLARGPIEPDTFQLVEQYYTIKT